MHDRRRIRALAAAGARKSEIARAVGCSRGAVDRALAPGAALSYRRARRYDHEGLGVDLLLARFPAMTSVALAAASGWSGSLRQLQREVHRRRPAARRGALGLPVVEAGALPPLPLPRTGR